MCPSPEQSSLKCKVESLPCYLALVIVAVMIWTNYKYLSNVTLLYWKLGTLDRLTVKKEYTCNSDIRSLEMK